MVTPLKIAIIRSGRTQREIAAETGIRETRLSTIVRGWIQPTTEERAAIRHALRRAHATGNRNQGSERCAS